MRNLLMVLAAVLGTSAMVHAFPAKDGKTVPAKEDVPWLECYTTL